jgi:hypothetical protein
MEQIYSILIFTQLIFPPIFLDKREFFWFFLCMYRTSFNTAPSCRPQIPLCRRNAVIELRTVATTALAVRRFSHSATSHPQATLHLIFKDTAGSVQSIGTCCRPCTVYKP